MPAVAVAAIGAAAAYGATQGLIYLGIGTFAATLIGAVAGLVVTSGLSALLGLNRPPEINAVNRIQTFRSAVGPKNVVYGQTIVTGPVVFLTSTGDENQYFHVVVALAGHVISKFNALLLNNYWFAIDPLISGNSGLGYYGKFYADIAPNLTPPPVGPITVTNTDTTGACVAGAGYNDGTCKFNLFDGTQTAADADLIAATTSWTTAHKLLGIAYVHAQIAYSQDVFGGGFQTLACQVEGKPVWDIRTGATGFSNNAALCILDYLMSDDGLSVTSDEIDTDFWVNAANICDETIAVNSAGTVFQTRYTLNGSFTLDQTPIQIMEYLLATCGGTLTYVQGKYRLYVAAYDTPTVSLSETDFAGKVTVTTQAPSRAKFNTITGTYIEPDRKSVV